MNREKLLRYGVYQIYPYSFKDINNDGYGDILGIVKELDYFKFLGVKIIWLSPIYPSPLVDMGYDISDYKSINPLLGTMDDFDLLIEEAKKRGIKIVMDMVMNHTSSDHPWFKEAINNKNSPYRDYYFFRQGKENINNWQATMSGSAWTELDNEKGTYYLHLYSDKQPDLNWQNPAVYNEFKNILEFWLKKGVYGFRLDVITQIYKESLEDGKKVKIGEQVGREHYLATEGCHRVLRKLREDVLDKYNGIFIGECYGIDHNIAKSFSDNELDTLFLFELTHTSLLKNKINMRKFKKNLIQVQTTLDYNGNFLENHDQHRSIGRYVKDKKGAKMLLTLLFTLKGIPFIYQGEELALQDYQNFSPSDSQDMVYKHVYKLLRSYHLPNFIAKKISRLFGRDDARYPYPFNNSVFNGFSSVKPWSKVYDGKENREEALNDKNSSLYYLKELYNLRKNDDVLCFGNISFLKDNKLILSYIREYQNKKRLIILNLSNKRKNISNKIKNLKKELLLSTSNKEKDYLQPYEGRIYSL